MTNTKKRTLDKHKNLNIRVSQTWLNHLESLTKVTGMQRAEIIRLAVFEKYLDQLVQTP